MRDSKVVMEINVIPSRLVEFKVKPHNQRSNGKVYISRC
jgi:hypothetical protein